MSQPDVEEAILSPEFLKKLEALRFFARRLHRSGSSGEHSVTTRGMSLEFTDYRKYNPGDDFRYIDWNAFSRLERLFLKVFSAEEDILVYLLVDVSHSMRIGRPSKLVYAARLAMALSYVGITNYDRVGAAKFSNDVLGVLPPVRGKPAVAQLYRFFSELRCEGNTDFNGAMSRFADRITDPALIFILSDMFDERGSSPGLELLRHGHNEVVLVHLLAEEDLNPRPSGPLNLIDSETGMRRKILADDDMLRNYRKRLNNFTAGIEKHCRKCGVEYYLSAISTPVEQLVLKYLRRGRHFQ